MSSEAINYSKLMNTLYENIANDKFCPNISIVTPVYKNDPSPLLNKIFEEAKKANLSDILELIIVDDGSNDENISANIKQKIKEIQIPSLYIEYHINQGRSGARNCLIANAKGEYILFLDSDMLPDCPSFISNWLKFINQTAPTIAYGGFTTLQASQEKKYDLARELAQHIDCLDASERRMRGPLAVATSNLLVRRNIMDEVRFDCGFKGWGWEDVDWALRANAANYAVTHFENPATHLGLDEAEVILAKFKNAGPNFKHITNRHPQMLNLKSTKAARIFAHFPIILKLAPFFKDLAMSKSFPLKIRAYGARAWRAIWAAKSLL